ncbi:HotDog domain-containing protein [Xylaria cf. heliscus]|nr:HotDog domain-containing protein [Xylaria cf. heliscus]
MDAKHMDALDHAHFAAIPWCARHLQGDRVVTRTAPSRTLKSTGEDSLFADTLNSERGIVRMLQVHEQPLSPTERVAEVKAFLTLGSGLNGYPNVCHGGLVTTILDEVIGMLLPINQDRGQIPVGTYMTAYLNTTFVRPVPTPATILARTWFTKIEGRKYYTQGTIEDKNGDILARADALFVLLRSSL